MTLISMIAAMDESGGLGINNQLLCHLPADLQHFKMLTMGKPIIMGRKTFESIGKPLPGRLNIVLSRSPLLIDGTTVVNSLAEAFNHTKGLPEVVIIGGGDLFAQAMTLANRLYITRIHHRFRSDVFFPTIDNLVWRCQKEEFRQHDEKNKYDMTFLTYERN